MADSARVRLRIWGVVQGVGYRYFVRKTAERLALAGHVRNRADGSVEVVAEGQRPAVEALMQDLRTGPRYASVDGMDVVWEEPRGDLAGFNYAF
jgi:acylphosphatase